MTANKDLIASDGKELLDAAAKYRRDFLFEAAVAGGIPIIRPLKQCLAGNHLDEVMGIVNGTTNFILTKMTQEGMEFQEALAMATQLGYAEADPTADIEAMMRAERWPSWPPLPSTPESPLRMCTQRESRRSLPQTFAMPGRWDAISSWWVLQNSQRRGIEARVHPMLIPQQPSPGSGK